jgi:signal transduction histidine kinase
LIHGREYRWRDAAENPRIFLDQAVLLSDSEAAIAGTVRDITEQRALEDQLLQAQKMDAVGKLTGGVAHDFNNLLASVLSGLSLIERRGKLPPAALEVLEMTRHAAEQGKHLVDRLLAFSRRQNLSPRRVDLAVVSKSIDAMLAPLLGGLVNLRWELEPALWETFIDPSQLELAIMNLVINSRDALPDGGTISITLANRIHDGSGDMGAGEFVVLTVADRGSGIPADILPRVLEPFFTTKEVGRGTGLGLSMAYGFARQSGGTLLISSSEGVGTNVQLWLPRAKPDLRPGPVSVGSAVAAPHDVARRQAHVLLVDDSQTLRKLTSMQLEEAGYTTFSVSSGVEAIAVIGEDPGRFDVLLTDYAMPMMSGLELVAAARQHRPEFPAVIVTGFAELEAMRSRPENVAVIPKPFTAAALVEVLESAMQSARVA